MDYAKMYCGTTSLDKLVREKASQGWKMFCHEHPENHKKISLIFANNPDEKNQPEINDVEFNQNYLYKDGRVLGACAIARFWRVDTK